MKKLRQSYWFITSITKRHGLTILMSAIIGILVTVNIPKYIKYIPQSDTLYVGRTGSFSLSQLPLDIQLLVSQGLTSLDKAGVPQPAVAQSWQVKDNGTLYQFTIDPNQRWSDGQPVKASEINYSFNDIVTTVESDSTISFQLKESYAPFPSIASQPLFKKDVARSFPFFRKTQIIGVNDYRINDIKTRGNTITSLTLQSDDQKRIYRFYPTEEDAITAFKLGKVDRLENISNLRNLDQWAGVSITPQVHQDQYLGLFFNTTDTTLSSKPLRQALAYAIETKSPTPENRAISPIPSTSWVHNPQVKKYEYDTQTATQLLQKEFPNADQPPQITLTTTQTYAPFAEKIIASWKNIGIDASLKIVNFPDTNEYQALLIGQQSPADPDQYTLWHSTQGTNFTHYNNPRIDKLLEDGRKTQDPAKRELIYQDFQRFLVEDVPAVFLHYLTTYTIERG